LLLVFVYVGSIAILFLFASMFLDASSQDGSPRHGLDVLAVLAVSMMALMAPDAGLTPLHWASMAQAHGAFQWLD